MEVGRRLTYSFAKSLLYALETGWVPDRMWKLLIGETLLVLVGIHK